MTTKPAPAAHVTPLHQDGPTTLVAQGHAVLRIENDTLAQIALQRPRDEEKVLKACVRELEMVPDEASKAYYEIPYRDSAVGGQQKMVKVSGPSIRAATALARRWGNCSATARILTEDEASVDLEGVFIDFETSVRFTRPIRVQKYQRAAGRMVRLDGKRLEAAVGAGGSKAMRNAILTGLPAYLIATYDKRAREIVAGKKGAPVDPAARAAILKAFEEARVSPEQLEGYLDKPKDQWTGVERASLVGLYNAIRDGQVNVSEVFGTNPGQSDPVTVHPVDLFLGAGVTGTDMSEPGKP